MRVLGLVSGGKDSIYSLVLAALKYKHELVALAQLVPAPEGNTNNTTTTTHIDTSPTSRIQVIYPTNVTANATTTTTATATATTTTTTTATTTTALPTASPSTPLTAFSPGRSTSSNEEMTDLSDLFSTASTLTTLPEEVDSHMFQTVGHSNVRCLSAALQLPLYIITLSGTSKHRSLTYTESVHGDEIEDLFALVQYVQQHEKIQAVSSGAILSNYQRLRIEYVCHKLNLTSLAYLWERVQNELLYEMITCGMKCILIKVASAGLLPKRHLGRTLLELYEELLQLEKTHYINICGEGGEYESFTLDSPLGKYSLQPSKYHLTGDLTTTIAPVGAMKIEEIQFLQKTDQLVQKQVDTCWTVWKQRPLSKYVSFPTSNKQHQKENQMKHQTLLQTIQSWFISSLSTDSPSPSQSNCEFAKFNQVGRLVFLGCIPSLAQDISQQISQAYSQEELTSSSAAKLEQLHMSSALTTMITHLPSTYTVKDITYVNLNLSNMDHFQCANSSYINIMPFISAPSRACLQFIPPKTSPSTSTSIIPHTSLCDMLAYGETRETLHVQSISEWAPACIGPYSQASVIGGQEKDNKNVTPHLILLAGQIGLYPPTMTLRNKLDMDSADKNNTSDDISLQIEQSFENTYAILSSLKSSAQHVFSFVIFWSYDVLQTVLKSSEFSLADLLTRAENCIPSIHMRNKKNKVQAQHIVVARLPRDALLEVQVMAQPNYVPALTFDSNQNVKVQDGVEWKAQTIAREDDAFVSTWITLNAPLSSSTLLPTVDFIQDQTSKALSNGFWKCLDGAMDFIMANFTHLLVLRVYYSSCISLLSLQAWLHSVFTSQAKSVPSISFFPVMANVDSIVDQENREKTGIQDKTELIKIHALFVKPTED